MSLGEKFDDFLWEWALNNVKEDYADRNTLLLNVFEALKPWLSIELWNAENKEKAKKTTYSTTYIDRLRARGVTEEQLKPIVEDFENLKKEEKKLQEQQQKEDDDDSQLRVIS